MLTIDSNLKIKELDKLCNVLIKSDIINFNIKKVGGGFPKDLPTKIINKLNYKRIILVINDLSLEMTNELLEVGYKLEDITLAFGKWNNNGTISDDKIMYNIMNDFIKHNIKEKLNVIFLGDIFMGIKHWDCVIVNPPYNTIGANITDYIRQNIDYDLYVNLLPANDYKRNKTKDLFNYQTDMEPVNNGFTDAAVTTHLAIIHKNKVNNMTLKEFIIAQFTDKSLDKYFKETNIRKYNAFENNDQGNHPELWSLDKTVIMGFKDSANGHMPYTKNCNTYKWNVEKSIDNNYLITNCNYYAKAGRGLRVPFVGFTFDTEIEHDNFVKFFYSPTGFKFMSKVITALNADSWVGTEQYMPKVDWTRPWTVEEILTDYGYTEDEIKEVITDLDNYKYLKD